MDVYIISALDAVDVDLAPLRNSNPASLGAILIPFKAFWIFPPVSVSLFIPPQPWPLRVFKTCILNIHLFFTLRFSFPLEMSSSIENADWDFVLQFVSEPLDLEMPAPEKPVSGKVEPRTDAAVTQVPTPPVRSLHV